MTMIDEAAIELATVIAEKNMLYVKKEIVEAFGVPVDHWYVKAEADVITRQITKLILETVAGGLGEERSEGESQERSEGESQERYEERSEGESQESCESESCEAEERSEAESYDPRKTYH